MIYIILIPQRYIKPFDYTILFGSIYQMVLNTPKAAPLLIFGFEEPRKASYILKRFKICQRANLFLSYKVTFKYKTH